MVEDMQAEHRQVKQLFGDGARVGGTMGSRLGPGVVEIKVDGQAWGSGATLREAIGVATKRAATIATDLTPWPGVL